MIPAHKHRNICIAINILAMLFLISGRADIGAILLFTGLMKFETYHLSKQYEQLELDTKVELELKDKWVKHHQASVEVSLRKQHSMDDVIEGLKDELRKIQRAKLTPVEKQ